MKKNEPHTESFIEAFYVNNFVIWFTLDFLQIRSIRNALF